MFGSPNTCAGGASVLTYDGDVTLAPLPERTVALRVRMRPVVATLLFCAVASGCAAWTNPVAEGIPVCALSPELLAEPKEHKLPIPLTYLRQPPPGIYRLAAGDVLGVYIEGVLGEPDQVPPVNVVEATGQAPSLGFPVTIEDDGTLSLPQIEPINVNGMSVKEAKQAIAQAYTSGEEPILQPGRERIIVSLVRPRQVRVLVMRQDSPGDALRLPRPGFIRSSREFRGGAETLIRGSSSGSGTIVDLPAYQNDVLNALAQTGGLPGLDAANEIIIQRGYLQDPQPYLNGETVVIPDYSEKREITRIPLRLMQGQPLPFEPDDVVLQTGDVLVIEAREADLYYTGGLLPSGQYPLPRDTDLNVIEAITQIGGPLVNGGVNANNLSGLIVIPGVGAPSPRLITIIRKAPNGEQVPIIVDVNLALTDARENILVKPGDVLILQETRDQAVARYFGQFFNTIFVFDFLQRGSATGTAAISGLPP